MRGWFRPRGSNEIVVPVSDPADPADRLRHAAQQVRSVVGQVRRGGWQVFFVECEPGQEYPVTQLRWSVEAYRWTDGYVVDLQVSAESSIHDRENDGRVDITMIAPYHLDEPDWLRDVGTDRQLPEPLNSLGCLDGPDTALLEWRTGIRLDARHQYEASTVPPP